jgi:hypothetical protein
VTGTEPHRWPGCPWPGWAQLYAQLIRDVRAADPDLIVEDFEPGTLSIGGVTSSLSPEEADAVFDRIEAAERLTSVTCVVCGGEGSGWPPLCGEHGG